MPLTVAVLTPHASHQLGEAPKEDGEGVAQLIGAGFSPPGIVSLQMIADDVRDEHMAISSLTRLTMIESGVLGECQNAHFEIG